MFVVFSHHKVTRAQCGRGDKGGRQDATLQSRPPETLDRGRRLSQAYCRPEGGNARPRKRRPLPRASPAGPEAALTRENDRAGTRDAGLGDAAAGRQVAGVRRVRAPGRAAARRPSPRGGRGGAGGSASGSQPCPPRKPTDASPPEPAAGGPTASAAAHRGGVGSSSG